MQVLRSQTCIRRKSDASWGYSVADQMGIKRWPEMIRERVRGCAGPGLEGSRTEPQLMCLESRADQGFTTGGPRVGQGVYLWWSRGGPGSVYCVVRRWTGCCNCVVQGWTRGLLLRGPQGPEGPGARTCGTVALTSGPRDI